MRVVSSPQRGEESAPHRRQTKCATSKRASEGTRRKTLSCANPWAVPSSSIDSVELSKSERLVVDRKPFVQRQRPGEDGIGRFGFCGDALRPDFIQPVNNAQHIE